jgi:hypothetical protein
MTRRLGALLALELRTQWRQNIPVSVLGLAAFWSGLLVLLPARTARVATPYLLFLEIMTVGTLFAGALTVTDRSTGATAALGVSPARSWERVTARLAPGDHFGGPEHWATLGLTGGPASEAVGVQAMLAPGGKPEVIISPVLSADEAIGRPPAWVRLDPPQAANLAAILETLGQHGLAGLIRQAVDAVRTTA